MAVTIFSDAQAALDRLRSDSPGPGQKLGRLINAEAAELRKWGIHMEYRWVPGHSDIPDNEAADAAAKRATKHWCTAGALV
jgi:ribonuclease HI